MRIRDFDCTKWTLVREQFEHVADALLETAGLVASVLKSPTFLKLEAERKREEEASSSSSPSPLAPSTIRNWPREAIKMRMTINSFLSRARSTYSETEQFAKLTELSKSLDELSKINH